MGIKRILFLPILFLSLVLPFKVYSADSIYVTGSHEFEPLDYITYFGTTDKTITMAWDAAENAVKYDIRLYHVEQHVYLKYGYVEGLQVSLKLPKTGHYIPEIRSVGTTDDQVSEWVTSLTAGTVNGELKPWWLYGYVAPPGPIIIN